MLFFVFIILITIIIVLAFILSLVWLVGVIGGVKQAIDEQKELNSMSLEQLEERLVEIRKEKSVLNQSQQMNLTNKEAIVLNVISKLRDAKSEAKQIVDNKRRETSKP